MGPKDQIEIRILQDNGCSNPPSSWASEPVCRILMVMSPSGPLALSHIAGTGMV